MLVEDNGSGAAAYVQATGKQLDTSAVRFFRLTLDLADLAAFVNVLRSPQVWTAGTETAHDNLLYLLDA
jgi:hypothetical protein